MAFRKPLKITSRTSSVTNSFVQAIVPHIAPTRAEVAQALSILGMSYENRVCAYCGIAATDWDHLRPLVRDKRPTGYIDEIRNLVPSCGPCNQSQGASEWREWMLGKAPGSPTAKRIKDIPTRMDRLQRFEDWGNVKPLPISEWIGAAQWDAHWANLAAIEHAMKEAQVRAAEIRSLIEARLANSGAA